MITATFFKDSNGIHRGFSVIGHAGYAERGQDIICAGVSFLSINTVNSIEKFTSDKFNANMEENTGLLTFSFIDKDISEKSRLLIDSLILGLTGISDEYKDEHFIQIIFKEV